MNSWRQRFDLIARLIGERRGLAVVMFGVTFIAALAESFGLFLVLPILSGALGLATEPGMLTEISARIENIFPGEYRLEMLLVLLALAFLAKGILTVTARGVTNYFALRLRDDWASALFKHYLSARRSELAGQKLGSMVHNVAQESYRASRGVALLFDFLNRTILVVVLTGLMLLISWQATAVVALSGAIVFTTIRKSTFRYSLTFGKLRQKTLQQITAIAAETLAATNEIKLFGALSRKHAEMGKRLGLHTRSETKFRVFNEIPVQTTELMLIVMFGVGLVILTRVLGLEAAAYAGQMGLFLLVGQRLMTNVNNIISQRMKIAAMLPAVALVNDLAHNGLDREDTETGKPFTGLKSAIEFRDVGFAYDPGSPILTGVNLVIPRGKTTAIAGASGVGKSTFADMLLGFIAPNQGTIVTGDHDWADYSLASLRQGIGYVTQSPMIFNATVRDNIRFGAPDATDAEVTQAAKVANADGFIDAMADGYDTQIGDRGENLSGGQRQRIAIARVALCRPSIYVFDEATNALDPDSESSVRAAIRELSGDATVILIAHGSALLEQADVTYRLEKDGAHRVSNPEAA